MLHINDFLFTNFKEDFPNEIRRKSIRGIEEESSGRA